jgi:hypothetical protein
VQHIPALATLTTSIHVLITTTAFALILALVVTVFISTTITVIIAITITITVTVTVTVTVTITSIIATSDNAAPSPQQSTASPMIGPTSEARPHTPLTVRGQPSAHSRRSGPGACSAVRPTLLCHT